MSVLDDNSLDNEDDYEPLRQRIIKRKMMDSLGDLDHESGNIIIPAMGGVIDNLSKYRAAMLDPVATVTGLPIHGHPINPREDYLRKMMIDRGTNAKQKALDDTNLLKAIEISRIKKMDMGRKENESDKKYGFLRQKLADDNSNKAARLGWDKEKEEGELQKAYDTLDAIMGRQQEAQKFKAGESEKERTFKAEESAKTRKQKDNMFAADLGWKMDEFHKNYEFKRAWSTGRVISDKARLEMLKDKLKADINLRGFALGQSQQKIDMAMDLIDKKHENEMEKLDAQQGFQEEQKALDRQNKIDVKKIPTAKAGSKNGFTPQQVNKMSQDFGKAIDAYANRAGAFGNVAKKLMSAEAVNGLFSQYPDYNIPPTASHELAAAIAGLVQNGSPQSQQQINNLTPESYRGNFEAWASKLLNEPRGLQQQKFMKMLHETAAREYLISRKQREEIIKSRLPDYWSYFAAAPDQAQKQIAARLGMKDTMSTTPIVMEMAKKMNYNLNSEMPSVTGSHAPTQNATNKAGTSIMSPAEQKAKAWAQSHLNDPANAVKAQNILKDLQARGFQ